MPYVEFEGHRGYGVQLELLRTLVFLRPPQPALEAVQSSEFIIAETKQAIRLGYCSPI